MSVNLQKAIVYLKGRAKESGKKTKLEHKHHIEGPIITDLPPSKIVSAKIKEAKIQSAQFGQLGKPSEEWSKFKYAPKKDVEDAKNLNIEYPLTPSHPKKDERVYAWAKISWSEAEKAMSYSVIEPKLTQKDEVEITKIKSIIEEKLNVKFTSLQKADAVDYLKNILNDIIVQFGFKLTPEQRTVYEYFILRDFIGFGKIHPLMNDPNIEDVSCDGTAIPLFVYHRNPEIGTLKTNVSFKDKEELDEFVLKLAQKCGRSLSVAEPLLDGALPDGSRVQATLGTDVARRGSNFSIRKFSGEPLTPIHLMKYGTADSKILAYLWYAIEHRRSILVSGATASGKTSLLNALSLFIPTSSKIISIEDTPELRLTQSHWISEVARTSFESSEETHGRGEVSLFDLLRSSLRQRPDYIIVGEVRGKEAYILFQAMATGHAGLSTIHADTIEKVIDRLITKPIDLPKSLLETLDVIVFLNRIKYRNSYVRRISKVFEIRGYDYEKDALRRGASFEWNPADDTYKEYGAKLIENIAKSEGLDINSVFEEIRRRIKVLDWMKSKDIANYLQFSKVISQYSAEPEVVMEWMRE